MGLYNICLNKYNDRKGSSPSFMEQKQSEDNEKAPLVKLFVLSEEHHAGTSQGC